MREDHHNKTNKAALKAYLSYLANFYMVKPTKSTIKNTEFYKNLAEIIVWSS